MAAPAAVPCSEKRDLIMRFTAEVRECNRLQDEQIKALLRGEGFMLETQITQATERRERTKYAVSGAPTAAWLLGRFPYPVTLPFLCNNMHQKGLRPFAWVRLVICPHGLIAHTVPNPAVPPAEVVL